MDRESISFSTNRLHTASRMLPIHVRGSIPDLPHNKCLREREREKEWQEHMKSARGEVRIGVLGWEDWGRGGWRVAAG